MKHQNCRFFAVTADCPWFTNTSLHRRRWWRELGLSWGPDVVGLSAGSQQRPFPLGELRRSWRGITPVYSSPIINTAGRLASHSYCCLLLFTFYSLTSEGRSNDATAVTQPWLWKRLCFLQQTAKNEVYHLTSSRETERQRRRKERFFQFL